MLLEPLRETLRGGEGGAAAGLSRRGIVLGFSFLNFSLWGGGLSSQSKQRRNTDKQWHRIAGDPRRSS